MASVPMKGMMWNLLARNALIQPASEPYIMAITMARTHGICAWRQYAVMRPPKQPTGPEDRAASPLMRMQLSPTPIVPARLAESDFYGCFVCPIVFAQIGNKLRKLASTRPGEAF
jgi:hypothetical protein